MIIHRLAAIAALRAITFICAKMPSVVRYGPKKEVAKQMMPIKI